MILWRLRFKVFNDVFISYVLIFRGFAYVSYRIQHLSIETMDKWRWLQKCSTRDKWSLAEATYTLKYKNCSS